MHHHRLVLNGPPEAVARLAAELRAAGAVALARGDGPAPERLVWATPRAGAVEALCARHRAVVVGVERFEALGGDLERLVVQGRQATLLERRPPGALERWGVCLDDDGAPLDPGALRDAARRVAAVPTAPWPALAGCALDDALLVGPAVGRLCRAAGDPPAAGPPPAAALDAIAALAAVALTIGAACADPSCPAELELERAWRLTGAAAHAGREALWARPGEADWPEWLMDLLACAAEVVACCAACQDAPSPCASVHAEHLGTADEQLDDAAGLLVATALQALVLFGEAFPAERDDCARN